MVYRIGVSQKWLMSLVYAVVVIVLAGCAGGPSRTSLNSGAMSESDAGQAGTGQASIGSEPPASSNPLLLENKKRAADSAELTNEPADDPFYDPFARSDEPAGGEEYDPWEPVNTKIFEFNRQMDRWVLKPVAQGYDFVVPNPVQIGISNLFYNIRFPSRFINNLAQGKLTGAGTEVGRFLLNSTFGFAGFVDVATELNITTPEEDTGQTLGYYGVNPGPYLLLPFLPPFTLRDFVGYLGDIALNPINWMVFPLIEVEGIPSLVAHHNRWTTSIAQISIRVGEVVNDRSLNLEKFAGVEEATLDLYTAVKNAYIQKRRSVIRE